MRKVIPFILIFQIAFGVAPAFAGPKSEATLTTWQMFLRKIGIESKRGGVNAGVEVEKRVAQIEAEVANPRANTRIRNSRFTRKYFFNLNERVNEIEPVLFRDQILDDMINTLAIGEKGEGFIALIGNQGVGKGGLVDTLAHMLEKNANTRARVGHKQILRLDFSKLQDLSDEKAKEVIADLRKTLKAQEGNYILHIESFQMLMKEPPHDGLDKAFVNLARETKTPVIVDIDRTRVEMENKGSFKDLLSSATVMDVPNLTKENELVEAMASYVRRLERESGTRIPYEAIYHMILLNKRFGSERGTFGVLHKALSELNAALKSRLVFTADEPLPLTLKRRQLVALERDLKSLQGAWGGAHNLRGRYLVDQREWMKKIDELRKEIARDSVSWVRNSPRWKQASDNIGTATRVVDKLAASREALRGGKFDAESTAMALEELFQTAEKYGWWPDLLEQKALLLAPAPNGRPRLAIDVSQGEDEAQLIGFIEDVENQLTAKRTELLADVPNDLRPTVSGEDVTRAMAKALSTNVDAIRIRGNVMQELRDIMKRRMVGQRLIVDDILELYQQTVSGTRKNPVAFIVGLFGKTSRGKSFISKNLAEGMGGTPDAYAVINLNGVTEKHAVESKMIGAPLGYQGNDEGGEFTNARIRGAKLINLDEINRTHPVALQYPMSLRDTPKIKNNKGRDVDFTGTGITMTANYMATLPDSFFRGKTVMQIDAEARKILKKMHGDVFKDEILNRFDRIYIPTSFLTTDRIEMVRKTWQNGYQDLLYSKPVFSSFDASTGNHLDIHIAPEVMIDIAKSVGSKADATRIEREIQTRINDQLSAMINSTPKQILPGDFINVNILPDGQYQVEVLADLRNASLDQIDEVLSKRRQLTDEMVKGLDDAEISAEEKNEALAAILNKIVNDEPLSPVEELEIRKLRAIERGEPVPTGNPMDALQEAMSRGGPDGAADRALPVPEPAREVVNPQAAADVNGTTPPANDAKPEDGQ